jgi:hypothetical protein
MSGNMFFFKVEGLDEIAKVIKELPDKMKKKEVQKIYARQLEPVKRALEHAAPTADKTVTYHRNKSIKFDIGNLGRSMRIFKGKGTENTWVFVGAQVRKPEGSGYYSHFVQYGTKGKYGIKRKNDFVGNTKDAMGDSLYKSASEETRKYIKRKAKRMGLDAR